MQTHPYDGDSNAPEGELLVVGTYYNASTSSCILPTDGSLVFWLSRKGAGILSPLIEHFSQIASPSLVMVVLLLVVLFPLWDVIFFDCEFLCLFSLL